MVELKESSSEIKLVSERGSKEFLTFRYSWGHRRRDLSLVGRDECCKQILN